MNSVDRKIWEDSLKDKNNVDLFSVNPGGPHAKPLPKKEIFTAQKQKKLEDTIKELKNRIEFIEKELKLVKGLVTKRKNK